MPHVSVVMPIYNAARTLQRAVRSILAQTLAELELIVVDDGSTDDSLQIAAHDRRSPSQVDSAFARGRCRRGQLRRRTARGPYVARMDADDFAHPARLASELRYAIANDIDVVGCRVRIVDDSGRTSSTMQRYARWINEETIHPDQISALRFVEFPLVNPTLLARRAYFELGYRRGNFPEDYDLMLRAAERGMRFGKVHEVLLDWTDGPQRLTRCHPSYSRQAFDRCRQVRLLTGPLEGCECIDLWGVGQTGKRWLRWLQGQGLQVRQAYDVSPRKQGTKIHGVQVMRPAEMPIADGTLLVIAVGAAGARDRIQAHIVERRYRPGEDAWFVS